MGGGGRGMKGGNKERRTGGWRDRREEGTRKDRRTDGGRVPMCAAGTAPASTLPGGHSAWPPPRRLGPHRPSRTPPPSHSQPLTCPRPHGDYSLSSLPYPVPALPTSREAEKSILMRRRPPAPGPPAAAAKSLQSCPTLCDPIDGSPPGSPVPGILQARVLEWGAIALVVIQSSHKNY